jgi:hypothetical protein
MFLLGHLAAIQQTLYSMKIFAMVATPLWNSFSISRDARIGAVSSLPQRPLLLFHRLAGRLFADPAK